MDDGTHQPAKFLVIDAQGEAHECATPQEAEGCAKFHAGQNPGVYIDVYQHVTAVRARLPENPLALVSVNGTPAANEGEPT